MLDCFNREINYLRISVTDRCNLQCFYCMPTLRAQFFRQSEILSLEEIHAVVKQSVAIGIHKFRLTGGEPLVRKDIVALVKMIAQTSGVEDLAMTTNGQLLANLAAPLALAGLDRVNISLDTLDGEEYKNITGGGELALTLAGIAAAKRAGLTPIKLNCVVEDFETMHFYKPLQDFAETEGLEIRYIRKMDIKAGKFWKIEGATGGNCESCNRLRLSSNGDIRPCLFSDLCYNVRRLGSKEALKLALGNKPQSGTPGSQGAFYSIGG